jgi:hypothetical protein
MSTRHDHTPEEIEAKFPRGVRRESTFQYRAAWAVLVFLAFATVIQAIGAEPLGIPPVAFRWLGVVVGGLGMLQGFLPKIQKPPEGRG